MTTQTGKVLRNIIKERRLTIKEIAQGAGIPASTLGEWINNRTPKNPAQVRKVAEFLGISTHFLLFGEEDRQEPISKIIREDFFQGTFEITVRKVKF